MKDVMDKLTQTAPEEIYLDVGDTPRDETFDDEGVTWSDDDAAGNGIKYIRASLVEGDEDYEIHSDDSDFLAGSDNLETTLAMAMQYAVDGEKGVRILRCTRVPMLSVRVSLFDDAEIQA